MTATERFWGKVDRSGGCWLWTGATTPDGYGRFSFRGKTVYAHRFVWTLHNGTIPRSPAARRFICHRCDTPGCVNPDHLFLGTNSDNMRDAAEKKRRNAAAFAEVVARRAS